MRIYFFDLISVVVFVLNITHEPPFRLALNFDWELVRSKEITGGRSTFEFPSRVDLPGPSLYTYLAQWTRLAGATRLTRSDFMLTIG